MTRANVSRIDHTPLSLVPRTYRPADEPEEVAAKTAPRALQNVAFADFVHLVKGFGFKLLRVSGSHHIFGHSDIPELVNLQEVGGQAKPYQIRQILRLVERYNVKVEED